MKGGAPAGTALRGGAWEGACGWGSDEPGAAAAGQVGLERRLIGDDL